MHAVQVSGASVRTADPSISNVTTPVPKQHRYSSRRSNSFSSASLFALKHTESSNSSGTGARNSAVPMRSQSPGETSLITLRVGRESQSRDHRRRKSVAVDATDRADSNAFGSQQKADSRSSSTASVSNTRRSRASSVALLGSLANQSYSPKKRSAGAIDYSPRASLQKQQQLSRPSSRPSSRMQQSPAASPERERRRPSRPELGNPLNNLPSLNAMPYPTDPNDTESPSTPRTVATPSTQTSYGTDYFNDGTTSPERMLKSQRAAMTQDHAGSISTSKISHTRSIDSLSSGVGKQSQATSEERMVSKKDHNQPNSDANPSLSKDSGRHKSSRMREKGEKEKKTMLSRALAKANTAVILDNEQNFEGALDAYSDACRLLQQVMDRSTASDDKRKLEAIKGTYVGRIDELQQMRSIQEDNVKEKSLPARPTSDDSLAIGSALGSPTIDSTMEADANLEQQATGGAQKSSTLASESREVDDDALQVFSYPQLEESRLGEPFDASQPFWTADPFEHEDPPPNASDDNVTSIDSSEPVLYEDDETEIVAPLKISTLRLHPLNNEYLPAPLSPRRPSSPQRKDAAEPSPSEPLHVPWSREQDALPHIEQSNAQPQWLDTIEEDRSSRASSVHSMSSQQGLRRKYLRAVSATSNPDFDAAFDAAVEAAYDQGLEPDLDGAKTREAVPSAHTPHESIAVRSSEIAEIGSPPISSQLYGDPILGADEEEERIMDDIARDYARAFSFDPSTKSALPRQSDSSGYSRSTWQSSQNSDRTTAATSLSTVAEDVSSAPGSKNAFAISPPISSFLQEPSAPSSLPPAAPPPQTSLPKIPNLNQNRQSGVRSRRLSGQNMKQLKIETPGNTDVRKRASTFHNSTSPFKEDAEQRSELDHDFKFGTTSVEPLTASDTTNDTSLRSPPSLDLRSAVSDTSIAVTTTTSEPRPSIDDSLGELRSYRPTLIRKNKSSGSLQERMFLLSSPTVENAPSMMTPLSSTFITFASKRNNETSLTSQRANLPALGSSTSESNYTNVLLFDTSLSASEKPATPKSPAIPAGVEPCPESFLLRPFWVMRNVLQTLTHPKGAFLTTNLFMPKEVWQTKGVKIKYLEDKIANCDLLTAALGRLSSVNTFDADAVMTELQSFEDVMERVQNTLVKRLGSEVGLSSLPGMFKEAANNNATPDPNLASDASTIRTGKEGKGYLASWRKLRSKSSGAPISSGKGITKGVDKDSFNLSSVPMTSWYSVERRGQKRDVRNMTFEGPNREYMSSLARLSEAVQVLDQIARQVEDPGLRSSSSTHVGMELSIRHAAEFFGFYICRFVLTDVSLLLEKFVKRGTEWVLA